jgi:hypothetical protein
MAGLEFGGFTAPFRLRYACPTERAENIKKRTTDAVRFGLTMTDSN